MELDEKIHARIESICKEGDQLADVGKVPEGIRKYEEAWALLPNPKEEWEAATWILAAIGDALFRSGQHGRVLETLGRALKCPDGLGNPFIHLRLGESAYELGNMRRADDELTRAYMAAGRDIFKKEDPKYFKRLEGILKPPLK